MRYLIMLLFLVGCVEGTHDVNDKGHLYDTTCLDGFVYYRGAHSSMAPKFNEDGEPLRCEDV